MIRKLTRQERILSWLISRLDTRLWRVSEREFERARVSAAGRVIAYVEASRRN